MVDVFQPILVITLLLLKLNVISDVQCDCILSLDEDFGSPSPVFIRDGSYMKPNAEGGAISFRRSETLTVACPGSKGRIVLGNDTSSYSVMEAHCIINTTFRVDRRILPFKDIRCNTQPYFTTEQSNQTCTGGNKFNEVGYKIKNEFYPIYTVCFDKYLLRTYYVVHTVTSTSIFMQKKLPRPQFIEGTLFGKVRMSALYKIANQENRLNAILGENMGKKYISQNQALTRGHLAARADFTLSAEARATFHYVNTAPQWRRGNAGDWAALEEAIRRRVQSYGSDVIVYTGTHGVMTLPNSRDQMKEIYLYADENNNEVLPVPMYYYKVVYAPREKRAAVFISINSSFYNNTMIESLEFCDDICAGNKQFSWLRWRPKDGTHSFCCDYYQFIHVVDYLPKLKVDGQFL